MTDAIEIPKPRRELSPDNLIDTLRRRFDTAVDSRRDALFKFSMTDTLTCAFAMYATKQHSTFSFQDHHRELNIEGLCQIQNFPSDSKKRSILDGIDLEPLHRAFVDLFW